MVIGPRMWGTDIVPIHYIQSDGNTYIDTDLIPFGNFNAFDITFKKDCATGTDLTSDQTIFGCVQNDSIFAFGSKGTEGGPRIFQYYMRSLPIDDSYGLAWRNNYVQIRQAGFSYDNGFNCAGVPGTSTHYEEDWAGVDSTGVLDVAVTETHEPFITNSFWRLRLNGESLDDLRTSLHGIDVDSTRFSYERYTYQAESVEDYWGYWTDECPMVGSPYKGLGTPKLPTVPLRIFKMNGTPANGLVTNGVCSKFRLKRLRLFNAGYAGISYSHNDGSDGWHDYQIDGYAFSTPKQYLSQYQESDFNCYANLIAARSGNTGGLYDTMSGTFYPFSGDGYMIKGLDL